MHLETLCERALYFICVLFYSSASFQTLCCTVWAASTCWLYTGSCWLTPYWWTGRPCRMQVTHTTGASFPHWRYSWFSWLTVQIRCLSVSDLICSPILSTFPVLLDQPDLLDALRVSSKSFMVKLITGCILIMLFIIAVLVLLLFTLRFYFTESKRIVFKTTRCLPYRVRQPKQNLNHREPKCVILCCCGFFLLFQGTLV